MAQSLAPPKNCSNCKGDRVAIDEEIRGLAIICREGHRAHDFTICMLAAGCCWPPTDPALCNCVLRVMEQRPAWPLVPGRRDTDASSLAPGKIIFGSSEWGAVLHLASRFYTQLKIYSPHPYSIQTPYLWDLLGLTKTKCFTSITFRRPHLDRIKTALYTRMQEFRSVGR